MRCFPNSGSKTAKFYSLLVSESEDFNYFSFRNSYGICFWKTCETPGFKNTYIMYRVHHDKPSKTIDTCTHKTHFSQIPWVVDGITTAVTDGLNYVSSNVVNKKCS